VITANYIYNVRRVRASNVQTPSNPAKHIKASDNYKQQPFYDVNENAPSGAGSKPGLIW